MTITQLSYVVAVDTHRHFAKAAEQCFVSQPTLSMQIQKLEEALGIAIFDRSKQPIVPTEIGVKIIQQARVILTESARVGDIISNYSNKVAGEFRIGIIPTVAAYLVPLFLQSFMKRYPEVELIIDEIQTDVIIDYLQKDRIDIGILATPLSIQGIVENPVYYEPFVAYLPKNHPLLALEKLSADDLTPGELMLLDEGNCFREQTIQLCSKFGEFSRKHKRMHFEGGNLETLKRLVDKNFGITVLPYLMISDFQTDDEKSRCRPFSLPQPTREISVVYGKSFLKSQIIKAFIHELKSHLPNELLNKKASNVLAFK